MKYEWKISLPCWQRTMGVVGLSFLSSGVERYGFSPSAVRIIAGIERAAIKKSNIYHRPASISVSLALSTRSVSLRRTLPAKQTCSTASFSTCSLECTRNECCRSGWAWTSIVTDRWCETNNHSITHGFSSASLSRISLASTMVMTESRVYISLMVSASLLFDLLSVDSIFHSPSVVQLANKAAEMITL